MNTGLLEALYVCVVAALYVCVVAALHHYEGNMRTTVSVNNA
jgi:hypothetical protein